MELKRDQNERSQKEKRREEKKGKRRRMGTYRILLVGFAGLDFLIKAVDLVLEVLYVLLVFFLLL